MNNDALEIAEELKKFLQENLFLLLEEARELIQSLPEKSTRFEQIVRRSLTERLFLLFWDILDSFKKQTEIGYFTTASLTRTVFETVIVIFYLESENLGESKHQRLSNWVGYARKEAEKRKNALFEMASGPEKDISDAACNEAKHAKQIVETFDDILEKTKLSCESQYGFPKISKICEKLGRPWKFMYHAVYRDLSEVLHVGCAKIMHSPSLAFCSSNSGSALLYEHCRTVNYATEFWGMAILELCRSHLRQEKVDNFHQKLEKLLGGSTSIINRFDPDKQAHAIIF
ncbi:MAG: DUF5677 domain-containing protein [bacterium]